MPDQKDVPPGAARPKGEEQPRDSFQAFVEELRWRQPAPQTAPEQSARAVLCALERRLLQPDVADLHGQLPKGFLAMLRLCERHAGATATQTPGSFIDDVAEHLKLDQPEAERVVRAVFSALRDRLPELEIEDLASTLPSDLAGLWRRPA